MARKIGYYEEIDKAIQSYENCKSWHDKSIDWICNRIDWCWKFRKISESQMVSLADRIAKVMEGDF